MNRKGEIHRKYTLEEKLEVVRDKMEHGLSKAELSAKYGISSTTIRDWIRQYQDEGEAGLVDKHFSGKPLAQYTPIRKKVCLV